MTESKLIQWLYSRLAPHRNLLIGPGDDAALIDWPVASGCVVSVDVLMDGVDFELTQIDPRRAGRKALAVNLSDLAAMAAVPRSAVIGLVLPQTGGDALARQLYEGLLPLAEAHDLSIAGGDVNSWPGRLVISVTILGTATSRGALRRSQARPGDKIVVTGEFGGSILGHHLDFEPRVREALWLHERYEVHAAIDVSDGLALDISRMADASGCGFVLETARVPIAEAAQALARRELDPGQALRHALEDGEDFELVLAVPAAVADRLVAEQPLDVPLTVVGEFLEEKTCWQQDAAGIRTRLAPQGFEHRLD